MKCTRVDGRAKAYCVIIDLSKDIRRQNDHT